MSYKTILVHVDESRRASERIKIAAAIAVTQKAHLIGTAMTGASRYLIQMHMLAELEPNLKTHLDFLRERARRGLEDFETASRMLGLASFEKRLVDDEAGGGICLQGRFADLVLIGQNDPEEISPIVLPDFPQYVVLHSGRPVLIVPHSDRFDNIGKHVVIAWDGSMEATRAITSALPLLRCAQVVEILMFNVDPHLHGPEPGTDLALYLERHGIPAEIVLRQTNDNVGKALLSLAALRGADLVIMGAYGHTRFRDIVLGEVTRAVLETMTIPVLMSR